MPLTPLAAALIIAGLLVWLLLAPTIGIVLVVIGLILLLVGVLAPRRGRREL